MWNYVVFFRENEDKLNILSDYIDSRTRKFNDDIMNVVKILCDVNNDNYDILVNEIVHKIKSSKKCNRIKIDTIYHDEDIEINTAFSEYMFNDE